MKRKKIIADVQFTNELAILLKFLQVSKVTTIVLRSGHDLKTEPIVLYSKALNFINHHIDGEKILVMKLPSETSMKV